MINREKTVCTQNGKMYQHNERHNNNDNSFWKHIPESSFGLFLYSRYLLVQSACNTKYVSDTDRNHTVKPPSTKIGLSAGWFDISSHWVGLCALTINVSSDDVSKSFVYTHNQMQPPKECTESMIQWIFFTTALLNQSDQHATNNTE